jgi:hypothetical protein
MRGFLARCLRFCPNIVVLAIASSLFLCCELSVIPSLMRLRAPLSLAWRLFALLIFAAFSLWLFCWAQLMFGNPGRTSDDLRRRGLLDQIVRGTVPPSLQHLRLCFHCSLPTPAGAIHCPVCRACHLRFDHHCGVTGQCVADQNFKFFALNFLYGGICCAAMVPPSVLAITARLDVIPLVVALYGLGMTALLFGVGYCFVADNFRDAVALFRSVGKSLSFRSYLTAFGKTWRDRLIPVQREATWLAWPGVRWEEAIQWML